MTPAQYRSYSALRRGILASLNAATTAEEFANILNANFHVHFSTEQIKQILDKLLILSQKNPDNKTEAIELACCRIISKYFQSSCMFTNATAESCLEEMRDNCKEFGLAKTALLNYLSREFLTKIPDKVLTTIFKNGIFEAFGIEEKDLTKEYKTQIFNNIFLLAAEHQNDLLLELLEGDKEARSILTLDNIVYARINIACGNTDIQQLKILHSKHKHICKSFLDSNKSTSLNMDILRHCVQENFPAKYNLLEYYDAIENNSDFKNMLITCAALKSKKPTFDAVVLNGNKNMDELKNLCNFMSDNKEIFQGVAVPFIISGNHWISGVILMSATVEVLLIDSLGGDSLRMGSIFTAGSPLTVISDTFKECTIHITSEKIQHAGYGCWVFAIDAIRKLQGITEIPKELPLSILRNTQSLSTINSYVISDQYSAQINKPINKRGLSFLDSVREHTAEQIVNEETKIINQRIEHKFAKLKEKVWEYLKNPENSDETIRLQTAQFTATDFIKINSHVAELVKNININKLPAEDLVKLFIKYSISAHETKNKVAELFDHRTYVSLTKLIGSKILNIKDLDEGLKSDLKKGLENYKNSLYIPDFFENLDKNSSNIQTGKNFKA